MTDRNLNEKEIFSEKKEEPKDLQTVLAEKEALEKELADLKKEMSKEKEKQAALEQLEKLIGSKCHPLYEKAIKRGDEQEELKNIPYGKRYEMSYYLCLGEDRNFRINAGNNAPPAFARSEGNGTSPAGAMKKPATFEMARENAKKYIGN